MKNVTREDEIFDIVHVCNTVRSVDERLAQCRKCFKDLPSPSLEVFELCTFRRTVGKAVMVVYSGCAFHVHHRFCRTNSVALIDSVS
jgi:hypothetical protein